MFCMWTYFTNDNIIKFNISLQALNYTQPGEFNFNYNRFTFLHNANGTI